MRDVHAHVVTSRWVELSVLYGVGPVVLAWLVQRYHYRSAMAPLLWVLSAIAMVLLNGDEGFTQSGLWRLPDDPTLLRTVGLRCGVLVGALLVMGRLLTPDDFLRFPRRRPALWLLLVLLYPTLSALPQSILWRALFVQRYAQLFHEPIALLVAGAIAFSWAHLTYRSVNTLVITFIGGALFLDTYLRSHSLLLTTLEHGVYGIVAFSAGLGRYLHMGARWRADQRLPRLSDSR